MMHVRPSRPGIVARMSSGQTRRRRTQSTGPVAYGPPAAMQRKGELGPSAQTVTTPSGSAVPTSTASIPSAAPARPVSGAGRCSRNRTSVRGACGGTMWKASTKPHRVPSPRTCAALAGTALTEGSTARSAPQAFIQRPALLLAGCARVESSRRRARLPARSALSIPLQATLGLRDVNHALWDSLLRTGVLPAAPGRSGRAPRRTN
mmetsp:Transcript_55059/g.133275  ORF Transcript_55059/g.133275 Transcript_55059/m.133275 type:complete len:206 (-) Transcript_55059:2987-3604(-)